MVAPLRIEGGIEVGNGIRVGTSVLLTTSGAQAYSSGATMATFRVLNRGGNWDEFFASWPNGTWTCVDIPGSVVINMTNPGDDSPLITISGGSFVVNQSYTFEGYY